MPREVKRQSASSPQRGSEPPSKKLATTHSRASSTTPSVKDMVPTLDAQTLRNLIIAHAPSHPPLNQAVQAAHRGRSIAAVPLSQMRPILDFDHYSKEAWHAYNDCKSGSGARQFEASFDA